MLRRVRTPGRSIFDSQDMANFPLLICYNFHKRSLIMLTDTHCHLDLDKFDDDRDSVIQRAIDAGVGRMLVPGLDLGSSRAAVELAENHSNVFAAVGFHPTDIEKMTPKSFEVL